MIKEIAFPPPQEFSKHLKHRASTFKMLWDRKIGGEIIPRTIDFSVPSTTA
jgi:hypothetical protein